jgi:hypothetical protein
MTRSRRQRYVTMLLTACLLLQQVVMSALACTMPLATAGTASMTQTMAMSLPIPARMAPGCHAAMADAQPAPDAGPLCEKHCAPDPTSASTPSIPALPALALPPVIHAMALSQGPPPSDAWDDAVFARSDPPTRLRYCRLLI